MRIPINEQDNFVSVYWQMLSELEHRINPKKDLADKILVEGAYKVLHRCGMFMHSKPRWANE